MHKAILLNKIVNIYFFSEVKVLSQIKKIKERKMTS